MPTNKMTGRIKGAAFREFVAWLAREFGQAELDRIVARIPERERRVFAAGQPSLGVLAGGWYDAAAVHAFLDALASGRDRRELDRLCTEGARAALESTLTGVHRAVLRVVGSPELHARFAQRLWNTHYEDGEVVSERVGGAAQRIAYRQWRSHHGLLCRVTTASDLVVFPLMGLSNVRVSQLSCIDRGGDTCAHLVEWD